METNSNNKMTDIFSRIFCWKLLFLILFGLSLQGPLKAADLPGAKDQSDFASFLSQNEAQLSTFFNDNAEKLSNEALTIYEQYFFKILVFILLFNLVIEMGLGRVFSLFFAPRFATMVRAFFYAGCKIIASIAPSALILGLIFTLGYSEIISLGTGLVGLLAILLIVITFVLTVAIQTWLVTVIYKTKVFTSFLFIIASSLICLILVNIVLFIVPLRSDEVYKKFVDEKVLPIILEKSKHLKTQIDSTRNDEKRLSADLKEIEAKIPQAQAEVDSLNHQIDEKLKSDTTYMTKIALIRASGDLPNAIKAYNEFLEKFPNSSLVEQAKTQINEMTQDLNTQIAEQKRLAELKKQDDAAREEAFLAHVKAGRSTLSEILQRFHFRSREEVSAVLGPPQSTAANEWVYSRDLVTNPIDGNSSGVIFHFFENKVQSVDYNQ